MCGQHAASVRLFVFYLSHGLVQVFKVELSHMGQNNGNGEIKFLVSSQDLRLSKTFVHI